MTTGHHCGFVTLIGRPNVGKSTLLNRLVGEKLSITSRRPQTTRHRIMGIRTRGNAQFIYVDTPGIHHGKGKILNRVMNRTAQAATEGVDCIIMLISARGWQTNDEKVLQLVSGKSLPVILAINKIDKLKSRERLLPVIDASRKRMDFTDIVPMSATKGDNVEVLENILIKHLPEQPPLFPEDQLTDRSERFIAAERVRQQVFRQLGDEIPYSVAVEIERFQRQDKVLHIDALIWVEKSGQKAIVIGQGGERLKAIGTAARKDMAEFFQCRVQLNLWVKVRQGWSDNERALRSLGYNGND